MVVFPKGNFEKGDYVTVKITRCTAGTLIGEAVVENENSKAEPTSHLTTGKLINSNAIAL